MGRNKKITPRVVPHPFAPKSSDTAQNRKLRPSKASDPKLSTAKPQAQPHVQWDSFVRACESHYVAFNHRLTKLEQADALRGPGTRSIPRRAAQERDLIKLLKTYDERLKVVENPGRAARWLNAVGNFVTSLKTGLHLAAASAVGAGAGLGWACWLGAAGAFSLGVAGAAFAVYIVAWAAVATVNWVCTKAPPKNDADIHNDPVAHPSRGGVRLRGRRGAVKVGRLPRHRAEVTATNPSEPKASVQNSGSGGSSSADGASGGRASAATTPSATPPAGASGDVSAQGATPVAGASGAASGSGATHTDAKAVPTIDSEGVAVKDPIVELVGDP